MKTLKVYLETPSGDKLQKILNQSLSDGMKKEIDIDGLLTFVGEAARNVLKHSAVVIESDKGETWGTML